MNNKIYHLTINLQPHTLTFIPPHQRDICFKCQLEKEISVISEKSTPSIILEKRKFCWFCALNNLYELEQGDYQIENKKEIIKELRGILFGEKPLSEKGEILACYE